MQTRTPRAEDRRIGHSMSLLVSLASAAGNLAIATDAYLVLVATVAFEHRTFDGQKPN